MRRRFHTLDVFTETPLAGNPLAVVLDCDGLDDAGMLAITQEFNLSETVFVSDPVDPVNTAAIRIFTPGGELPFAGHPTVGTAVLLASLRAPDRLGGAGVSIVLEEKIGPVSVDVFRRPGAATRAVFGLPRLSERLPRAFDPAAAAVALGLAVADLGFDRHELSLWSAGVPFVMVPLRSLEAVGRAGVADAARWKSVFGDGSDRFCAAYAYSKETVEAAHHVHARMFTVFPTPWEDPATGAAVAAFSGAAVAFEHPGDGTHQIVIEQGYEMGRPSQIVLDMDVEGGLLAAARIGGAAVMISEGVLTF